MDKINFFLPYESAVSALERTVRRLWILCIIIVVLLVGTNAYWIYNWSQYDAVATDTMITQDLKSGNESDITNGDVTIGKTETDN